MTMAVPAAALATVGLVLLIAGHPSSPQGQVHHVAQQAHRAAQKPHSPPCVELPTSGRFVGVAINPPLTQGIRSFGQTTASHPALAEFYTRFGAPFRDQEAQQAAEAGSVPFVQLNPRQASAERIAHGAYDDYLRRYAIEVRTFKCPVVLS